MGRRQCDNGSRRHREARNCQLEEGGKGREPETLSGLQKLEKARKQRRPPLAPRRNAALPTP